MKIAIIDYGSGNLKSVTKAIEYASKNVLQKSDVKILNSAKRKLKLTPLLLIRKKYQ